MYSTPYVIRDSWYYRPTVMSENGIIDEVARSTDYVSEGTHLDNIGWGDTIINNVSYTWTPDGFLLTEDIQK